MAHHPPSILPASSGTWELDNSIGVGAGVSRPSLRTVQAVFPHTALRSVVLPRRGLTYRGSGCCQAIQPVLGKEGVRPALVICPTSSSLPAQAFSEDAS
jgi:hypothetical protein